MEYRPYHRDVSWGLEFPGYPEQELKFSLVSITWDGDLGEWDLGRSSDSLLVLQNERVRARLAKDWERSRSVSDRIFNGGIMIEVDRDLSQPAVRSIFSESDGKQTQYFLLAEETNLGLKSGSFRTIWYIGPGESFDQARRVGVQKIYGSGNHLQFNFGTRLGESLLRIKAATNKPAAFIVQGDQPEKRLKLEAQGDDVAAFFTSKGVSPFGPFAPQAAEDCLSALLVKPESTLTQPFLE